MWRCEEGKRTTREKKDARSISECVIYPCRQAREDLENQSIGGGRDETYGPDAVWCYEEMQSEKKKVMCVSERASWRYKKIVQWEKNRKIWHMSKKGEYSCGQITRGYSSFCHSDTDDVKAWWQSDKWAKQENPSWTSINGLFCECFCVYVKRASPYFYRVQGGWWW